MFWDYQWWNGFDLKFLLFQFSLLAVLLVVTFVWYPDLFYDWNEHWLFWTLQWSKFIVMCFVAYLGGLGVLLFGIKVNYTRKIQHFCAYLIPLLIGEFIKESSDGELAFILQIWWDYWWVLLSFFVMIYPIRTRVRFVDIMFFSLDRPEDRPNTMVWIITQVVLGYIIITLFKWYFLHTGQDLLMSLIFIPVMITGVGDGMAEPIGVRFGKHKYRARAMCSTRKFSRSYEGSMCVLVTGWITVAAMYTTFPTWPQFLITFATVPIAMTIAEAFSPHTWDTPFLTLTGALLIWAITLLPI